VEHNIIEIFYNKTLNISLLAWLIAQTLKVVIVLYQEKKFNIERFVGAGGMPSSHSAFVMALSTSIGLNYGWNSPIYALALVFALVTMYDAAGVRRAAGQQAAILNKIIDEVLHKREGVPHARLKELLGHTPKQVVVGAVLGIVIAVVFH